jgi:hypothetical protein
MAGFRTSKKLTSDVCTAVYSAPSNASASVSVSVVAPASCTVFVQSTDLDPLTLSDAQTFNAPPSGLWEESFPDVFDNLRGAETNKNVAFQLVRRSQFYVYSSMDGSNTWDSARPYCWGYTESAATDVVSSDLKQTMAMVNFGSGHTWDKGSTTNNSSNVPLYRLSHDPLDFRYRAIEVAPSVVAVKSSNPRAIWHDGSVTQDSSTGTDKGYIGTCRHPDNNSGTIAQVTSGIHLYSAAPTYYNNYAGVAFYNPDSGRYRGISIATNKYISTFDLLASSQSDNHTFTNNRTTSTNWVRDAMGSYTLSTKFGCDLCPTGSSLATRGVKLYVTGTDGTTCAISMIDALDSSYTWHASHWTTNYEQATFTMPASTYRPVWMINSNGYYYVALHDSNSDGSHESGSDQALYRIAEDDFTTGTWSSVTVPAYVDLLPRPIIYADGKMAFAKWSDTTNDRMTSDSASATSRYDQDLWDDVGLAGLEVGATDTWTETLKDFVLDTYSSPNTAVTDFFSDQSFSPTNQRALIQDGVLFDLAFHTSETSFRTVSSNFPNRDAASDLTPALDASFERTNLVIAPGETVFAHDTSDGAVVHVYGYEDR